MGPRHEEVTPILRLSLGMRGFLVVGICNVKSCIGGHSQGKLVDVLVEYRLYTCLRLHMGSTLKPA